MAFSTVFWRHTLPPIERLADRLIDPARRERGMLVLLGAYTLVWALYGLVSRSSQDAHFDMVETAGWSRDLALGYPKHPPLGAYVAGLWFAIFPNADWSFYLLAILVAAVALWICWKIAGDYLDAEKRVAALALLTFVPFFGFHALKFNVNTVLIPAWAGAVWFFLRSYETRRPLWAALAGVFAGVSLLGKYWSIFLILGLGLAALLDRRRADYFRSPAPWITILAGLVVIGPHVAWLYAHDFAPFSYAVAVHGEHTFWDAALTGIGYLAGSLAYVAFPLVLAGIILRPPLGAVQDMLMPDSDQRRLVVMAFLLPILLPVLVAPFGGVRLTSLWTMSVWAPLPVVLLSSPLVRVTRTNVVQIVFFAVLMPLVMLLLSPLISIAIHRKGVEPSAEAHAKLLAAQVERVWRQTTDKPLRLIGGDQDLAYGAAFYLADRPSVFPGLSTRDAPWVDEARVHRDGIVIVCMKRVSECVEAAEHRASKGPAGQRAEVELTRRHFGIAGKPERYVIVTVPPG